MSAKTRRRAIKEERAKRNRERHPQPPSFTTRSLSGPENRDARLAYFASILGIPVEHLMEPPTEVFAAPNLDSPINKKEPNA